jgi:hypothetical protein
MNGSNESTKTHFAVDFSALRAAYVKADKTMMEVFGRQITRLEVMYCKLFQFEYCAALLAACL